ncbi:MAG: DUF2029 domain-containing protein [Aquabacterium sp.]|uniref:glycosyltransferase family 87 protein n=1 Tax=Aquabacterium sp. TaxID=1872578 RepID=UPI0025B80D6A|nr:glycosyltransferase family 87 protein [Aquabacterium sp.]MBI5926094.1 DUF2029 domain-containing protein [Aquabacterium sp.]
MSTKAPKSLANKWQELLSWMAIAITSITIMAAYIATGKIYTEDPTATDFYKFYLSAERLKTGESPYWKLPPRLNKGDPCEEKNRWTQLQNQKPVNENDIKSFNPSSSCLHPNLNPPIFGLVILPLSSVPFKLAWWIWASLSTISGIFAMWLLGKRHTTSKASHLKKTAWLCIALFLYYPTYCNFAYGQVTLFLLLPLTLSWLALERNQPLRAGAWLGIATAFKPIFALFIVSLLASRKPRAAASLISTTCVISFAGLLWLGGPVHADYALALRDITWTTSNWNASLTGFFARIFGGAENPPWLHPPLLGDAATTFFSLLIIFMLFGAIKQTKPLGHAERAAHVYALTIPALILISPLGWIYYFPLLTLSLFPAWHHAHNSNKKDIATITAISAIAITAIPRELERASDMNNATAWLWHGPLYTYALLAIFTTSFYLACQSSKRPHKAVST